MNLADKVAFIADAAAKIGIATCLIFAREGARIGAVDIYPERIGTLVKKTDCTGRKAQVVACLGTAEDIAGAAPYLTSDEVSFVTGAASSIDGGFSR
jgi:NAD(P)-dependent dehydrogenase (short-subunit alcohol dehydrogenase family)